MALEITKHFSVKAPPALVWGFLIDPNKVARCLPGAAITGQVDEKTFTGTMTVKVGPVSSSYKGKVTFEKLDAESHTAEIIASGQDVRGKGGADMKLTSTVKESSPGVTEVTAVSQVNITGILAQMGRGMIQDVSDQMFQIFSDRMRTELEAAAAASAAPAVPAPAAAAPAAAVGAAPAAAAAAAPAAATPAAIAASAPAAATPAPLAAATAGAPVEALDLGSVGGKVAGKMAGRVLTSPAFWLGLALGVLIDRLLLR